MGPLDVGGLFPLIAAAQQQNAGASEHGVVDTVSRPAIDPQFINALAERFAVAEVAERHPVDSDRNSGACPKVLQSRQPLSGNVFSSASNIATNLDRNIVVTYKSQQLHGI